MWQSLRLGISNGKHQGAGENKDGNSSHSFLIPVTRRPASACLIQSVCVAEIKRLLEIQTCGLSLPWIFMKQSNLFHHLSLLLGKLLWAGHLITRCRFSGQLCLFYESVAQQMQPHVLLKVVFVITLEKNNHFITIIQITYRLYIGKIKRVTILPVGVQIFQPFFFPNEVFFFKAVKKRTCL